MHIHAYVYICIYTCMYIHIYMSVHIHTYTYVHTHITCTYARTQARVERKCGSDCARSPTWRHETPHFSYSWPRVSRSQETRGRTTTTHSSSFHHHDSVPPRLYPLICTGAEPIHPIHGWLGLPATAAIPSNEITVLPFSRVFRIYLWKATFIDSRGMRNIFSRHRCLNLPEVLGNPPTPPQHPGKDSICKFDAKIQINVAKTQIFSTKTQICRSQTQIFGAKIQIFDPKFKSINFCTTKNLPLSTRKTPNPSSLSPTPPPSVLVKN